MSESTTASEAIHEAADRAAYPVAVRDNCWDYGSTVDAAVDAAIEAVRSLSPEQLAELIGGAVETAWIRTFTKDGSGGPIDAQDAEDAAEYAARASLWGAGPVTTHFAGRVVGPWLPVIPVTHQGEETT